MQKSDGGGTEAALEDMFKVSHNIPSTPLRSLTGEVRERTIWGYWAQGYDEMPEFFKLCVATWQRHNPHWDVRILQKSTVYEYLSAAELPNRFAHMLSHQAVSDCVRLGLLSRYGGVYMDVNILLQADLDNFRWNGIAQGKNSAAVFYHPHYGTEKLGGKDLVESWFLATKPGNPFFMRWRDLLRELLHNRLDTEGLLQHPLYQDIDLSGIDRLNKQFGADFDFREYLFIHSMCHRLLEKDINARTQWQETFQRIDAAETAFRMQLYSESTGLHVAQVLTSKDQQAHALAETVPLVKFRTPDYGPFMMVNPQQLLDPATVLGRMLVSPVQRTATASGTWGTPARTSGMPKNTRGIASGVFVGLATALMRTAMVHPRGGSHHRGSSNNLPRLALQTGTQVSTMPCRWITAHMAPHNFKGSRAMRQCPRPPYHLLSGTCLRPGPLALCSISFA